LTTLHEQLVGRQDEEEPQRCLSVLVASPSAATRPGQQREHTFLHYEIVQAATRSREEKKEAPEAQHNNQPASAELSWVSNPIL
jgi:hypothetical protein